MRSLEARLTTLEQGETFGLPARKIVFRVVYEGQEPPADFTQTVLDNRPGRPLCVVRWPKEKGDI